ncbi:flagellar motor protein MotD [Lysobacter arseniciresistens ZS79]|uniref:Flagellar motor protein MotD n=1 Tax=Lysobacter arseniciresistens ZS79 TaxID=913325 RepID=A0A0A0F2J4_9GAMM|nr:flagellar motor protein MotD [Lysobacter arseniciresistens]KGM57336.1 flagellar motor protein MotD [Lysobacter arseniciresistens ZS79]
MARRHRHEEHQNHEAWAIPYADLMTLLLAFFVVMYAISSLNEGKYRVLADSLSSAFGGAPRTISPIQLGKTQLRGSSFDRPSMQTPDSKAGPSAASPINSPRMLQVLDMPTFGHMARPTQAAMRPDAAQGQRAMQLQSIGKRIQEALSDLVQRKLVTVRRSETFLEVEIRSDILFASGSAVPNALATETVRRLAGVLRDEPNSVRVEGYTDDQPIHTAQFPSNWELSAARAGSVVHELVGSGVGPSRLAVVGFGEHQPVADNATVEGRNANRRVLLVILAAPQGPDAITEPLPPVMAGAATGEVDTATAEAGQPAADDALAPLYPLPDAASAGAALGVP